MVIGNDTKTRIFNAYIESIFLYNSDLCTLTAKHIIDVLHNYRTLLRRKITITKLDKMKNVNLYKNTNTEPWSKTIKREQPN